MQSLSENLKEIFVGPLIGHLTDTTINIFLGADPATTEKVYGFAIFDDHLYINQLKSYNNYTGIIHIDGLEPATKYTIQVGITTDITDIKSQIDSGYVCAIHITTQPSASFSGKATIGLISCHYPGHKSDIMFKLMDQILSTKETNNTPVLLHVGDQIYADQLSRYLPVKRADTLQEFYDLYQNKYKGKYCSQVVSKYPSIMTLDDHEIEDNWSMDRISNKQHSLGDRPGYSRDLFSVAIQAYKLYQLSHSPLYDKLDDSKFWYTFDIGSYPFFVLDTRTERYKSEGHMLGKPAENSQLTALCSWLKAQPRHLPKFIVSSVIFAPFTKADVKSPKTSDGWTAFPKTRKSVLQCIADNGIQKVVFLSGDVHNSMAVTINLHSGDTNIPVYQIISSPLYWVFPFADGDINDYVLNSTDQVSIGSGSLSVLKRGCPFHKRKATWPFKDTAGNKWYMDYITHEHSYTQLNNFAVIDFDQNEIDVRWYGYSSDPKTENNVLAHHTFFI